MHVYLNSIPSNVVQAIRFFQDMDNSTDGVSNAAFVDDECKRTTGFQQRPSSSAASPPAPSSLPPVSEQLSVVNTKVPVPC